MNPNHNPKTCALPPAPALPGTSAPQPAKLHGGTGGLSRPTTRRLARFPQRPRSPGPPRPNPQSYTEPANCPDPRLEDLRASPSAGAPRDLRAPNPQSYTEMPANCPDPQPEDLRAPRDLCAPTRKVTRRCRRTVPTHNPKTCALPPATALPGTSAPQPAKLHGDAGELSRPTTRRRARFPQRRRSPGPLRPNPQSYTEVPANCPE